MYVLFSKDDCMFCDMATEMLAKRGEDYVEIKVRAGEPNYQQLREVVTSSGMFTLPCVMKLVGGFDDLAKLLRENDYERYERDNHI